jgi:hypothetical protein
MPAHAPPGATVAVSISSGFWPRLTTHSQTRSRQENSPFTEADGANRKPDAGIAMRNSEFILRTLDNCLGEQLDVTLHLLGGAALDLVYEIQRFSEDFDCLCTMAETQAD